MHDLTPKQTVEALDQFIVGQPDAKRAVAVAIRNRWRRRGLDEDMAREVYPKNIIMSGPTGVGKTEIARRLASLLAAPFVKVEASKFTEVGYHGRDVESMIRDLLEHAIALVREEKAQAVRERAEAAAEDRLIDLLLPGSKRSPAAGDEEAGEFATRPQSTGYVPTEESGQRQHELREKLRSRLADGKLEDREVEVTITHKSSANMLLGGMGADQMDPAMTDMLEKMMPEKTERKRVTVKEARRVLIEQETDRLLDTSSINDEAISRVEQDGIVFLDEIDKVATPGSGSGPGGASGGGGGPDVSRQGVQRDLLPIVEGSSVTTRHGTVHTDHILFIAAGAFHSASVSDLMPELQGRFPIRVELKALTKADFLRILTEPRGALTRQQQALLGVEGLEVVFEDDAIDAIAEIAAEANATTENIGARRLMTVVEKVFESVNFDAPDRVAAGDTTLQVTVDYVREQVGDLVKDADLSRFVL